MSSDYSHEKQIEYTNRLHSVIKKHHLDISPICNLCENGPGYKADVDKFRRRWKKTNNCLNQYLFNDLANIITSYMSIEFICHFCMVEQIISEKMWGATLPYYGDIIYRDQFEKNKSQYIRMHNNEKIITIKYNDQIIKCATLLTDEDILKLLMDLGFVSDSDTPYYPIYPFKITPFARPGPSAKFVFNDFQQQSVREKETISYKIKKHIYQNKWKKSPKHFNKNCR